MAGRISPEIQRLLADRKLIRASASKAMVLKELDAAKNDLADAKDSLDRQKYKWQPFKDTIRCSTAQEPCCIAEVSERRAILPCL